MVKSEFSKSHHMFHQKSTCTSGPTTLKFLGGGGGGGGDMSIFEPESLAMFAGNTKKYS